MVSTHFKRIIVINVCFFLFATGGFSQEKDKHVEVALRLIGHQILLKSNDSTSRVLPLTRDKNQYRIQFESNLLFNPDSLVSIVNKVVKQTKIAKNYIVEVEQCETTEVVYSFEMDVLKKSDIIPCKGRVLPKSCYSVLFTIIDHNIEKGVNSNLTPQDYLLIILLVILLLLVILYFKKRSNSNNNNPNIISLGSYLFDKKNTKLIINNQEIDLTSKEADLLLLLFDAANTTVNRDVILNTVWGDEGDYIGRTVDVFISKLRKKLEFDSKLKIVNVRGVGYKLITND